MTLYSLDKSGRKTGGEGESKTISAEGKAQDGNEYYVDRKVTYFYWKKSMISLLPRWRERESRAWKKKGG